MKRFLGIILSVFMIFALVACSSSSAPETEAPKETEAVAETQAETEAAAETEAPAETEATASGDVITLRLANTYPKDHTESKMLVEMAEEVEKRSNGGLKLDIYFDSILGDYSAVMDEVMMGSIDMACQAISSEYDPRLNMCYIPYLYDDYEAFVKVYSPGSNCYEMMSGMFNDLGLELLGCVPLGYCEYWLAKDDPNFLDVDAAKSLLIRVPAIDTNRLEATSLGFNTVTIPFADLYTALQTGLCDGWQGSTAMSAYISFRDVIKYGYITDSIMECHRIFINQNTFNSLPEEYQKILTDVCLEKIAGLASVIEEENNDYIKQLEEGGTKVTYLTDEQKAAFADKVRTEAWPALEESLTKEVMDAARADVGMD